MFCARFKLIPVGPQLFCIISSPYKNTLILFFSSHACGRLELRGGFMGVTLNLLEIFGGGGESESS